MGDPPGATTFRTPAPHAYDRHIGRYGRELARALINAAACGRVTAHSTWAAGRGR